MPDFSEFNFKVATAGSFDFESPGVRALFGSLKAVLSYAAETVPLPTGALDVFTFAMPEAVKGAIYELQDAADAKRAFTSANNDSALETAGKTIGRRLADKSVTSSIVVDAAYLAAIDPLISAGTDTDEWNAVMQQALYVHIHEFGHCRDNNLRGITGGDRIAATETEWTLVSRHYADVLTAEFLACYYSAGAVSEKLHAKLIADWQEDAKERIAVIYRSLSSPDKVLPSVVHHLWIILVQYAKLIGNCAGNADLALPAVWQDAPTEFAKIFKIVADYLLTDIRPESIEPDPVSPHRSQNPACVVSADVLRALFPLWKRMAQILGADPLYNFVDFDEIEDIYQNLGV